MRASRLFAAIARLAARRPVTVLAVAVSLGLAGAVLALQLVPSAGTETLVGRSSAGYQATQAYHEHFGDEAVIVLIQGPVSHLVLSQDIERLVGLEGCLSGNAPSATNLPGGPGGPCARLARTRPVRVVYGPGTFINESVLQLDDQFTKQATQAQAQANQAAEAAFALARGRGSSPAQARRLGEQARQAVNGQFTQTALKLALTYGLRSYPRLNDPDFVSTLVFDPLKTPGTPKARFAYLFPTPTSSLVQVRLRPGLSDPARNRAIADIQAAVGMPQWHLVNGERYVVTGVPVIVSDLTAAISASLITLLIAALLVMAATLALVFRSRLPLLPLGIALIATALTFGALALVGASLTMATIGVVPVLIGLAVDYAIQFQSRYAEFPGGEGEAPERSIPRAAALGAPTIATAGAATAGGFLALLLSPVPMVRSFGLLLVVGIVLAFVCALTAGSAVLALSTRPRRAPAWMAGVGESVAAAWRGAGELLGSPRPVRRLRPSARTARARARTGAGALGSRLGGWANGALSLATRQPARVLGVALILAALGWGLDTQTRVESDIQKLVPQSLPALRNLDQLQRSTGVGGEIDVTVSAPDLTDPAVVNWMTSYQGGLLSRYGYSAARGCGRAQLCPAFSLPDLFRSGGQAPSQTDIRTLLNTVPAYFSQGVITADRRFATLAFGIRLMPLDQQERVISVMRSALHPPPGVHAALAGLPVLAADANARVSSPWRRLETLLVGLLAVGLVLLIAFRRPQRALIPLVPIILATGWSALILFITRIPLNPMSVTLGALVLAISTEFSVLLSERYRQELLAGHEPEGALRRTYRRTGAAVLASGATAIAGFAVLAVSDIRMLRDFGVVTVIDLTVSLLGVMVVLPATLVFLERGVLQGWATRAGNLVRRPRPRRRRRATAA